MIRHILKNLLGQSSTVWIVRAQIRRLLKFLGEIWCVHKGRGEDKFRDAVDCYNVIIWRKKERKEYRMTARIFAWMTLSVVISLMREHRLRDELERTENEFCLEHLSLRYGCTWGVSRAPTRMPLWFRLIIWLTGHSSASIWFCVDFTLWKNARPELQWGRTFYWKAPQLTKYTVCFAPSCVPRPLACVAKACGGNLSTEKLSLEFQLIFCTILIMQAQGTQANSQLPNPGGVLYCKGGRHSLPR